MKVTFFFFFVYDGSFTIDFYGIDYLYFSFCQHFTNDNDVTKLQEVTPKRQVVGKLVLRHIPKNTNNDDCVTFLEKGN